MKARGRSARIGLLAIVVAWLGAAAPVGAYEIRYEVRILPDVGVAHVRIKIEQAEVELTSVSLAFDPDRFFDEEATGELSKVTEEGEGPRLVWRIPEAGGQLEYSVRIDHVRDPAEYDARCTPSWLVARIDDLIPSMSSRYRVGAPHDGKATLRFKLPPKWRIAHPFEMRGGVALIEQQGRRFERPTGWIVAGRIDLVESDVAGTHLILAAPRRHDSRQRDQMAFMRFTLPSLTDALGPMPERVLIASADDPMWRGGLSAPGSVYVHADRPLIDDDYSSPLLHELVHMVTRANSAPGDDWIVEGVAEFYARELLRRAGAISDEEYEASQAKLAVKARKVKRLEGESTGAETALAVTFFAELDQGIRSASGGERSLDDVARTLSGDPEPISRERLVELIREQTGFDASALLEKRIPAPAPPAAGSIAADG